MNARRRGLRIALPHLAITSLLIAGALAAAEAPPAFVKKPTAAPSGDKTKIDFAVDRYTDVAITVEDSRGKIIRHLAAGMLGKNPPEPLRANSLAQSLEWDGRDDFGKAADGGPFRVRVQLGMKPEPGGFLMHNPDGSGEISSVAVGPGGSLYVFHKDGTANGNMGGHKIKAYSREGKHLKVLLPFPADIAPEKAKALDVFRTAAGNADETGGQNAQLLSRQRRRARPRHAGIQLPGRRFARASLLAGQRDVPGGDQRRRRHPLRHVPRPTALAGDQRPPPGRRAVSILFRAALPGRQLRRQIRLLRRSCDRHGRLEEGQTAAVRIPRGCRQARSGGGIHR